MRALDRKLIRDLWHMRGQALAIALIIACGVATYVMSVCTLGSLQNALDTYYERYRFADVFASLKRAPNALAERIAEIPGIARVQTRVVVSVTLDVEGLAEPAVGRLVSIPERWTPGLNDIYLRSGRYIEPGRNGEVLVSEAFADSHQLHPGNQVRAVINGRMQTLRIVGVALAPEYIYSIRPGDILPDQRRYGIFWMGYEELSAAFDMKEAFNDVAVTLMPGVSKDEVIRRLDILLEPYGGIGSYGREDQPSHKFISNEINELRGMAKVVPTIFLLVAAFLLSVVLSRLVNTQREQIAVFKAFGYRPVEVGLHYLKFVFLIVLVGSIIGTVVGAWLGRGVTTMYARFFHFPVFGFYLDPAVVVQGFFITTVAAVLGTVGAVRRAIKLPAAEAMRPEPPANYKPTLVERLGLQRLFSPAIRMILRHIERTPIKTLLSVLGISLAVAILVLGNFMVDAIHYVIESEFFVAQRQDVTIAFVEPTPRRVLYSVENVPGVLHAEPFRALSARIRSGHRERRLGIMGLEPEGVLRQLTDVHRQRVHLPPDGIVLSDKLAQIMDVGIGGQVTVEILEGERPVREVEVVGLIADFTGLAAYMDRRAANRLMQEGDVISGAFLAVDAGKLDALYANLKATPRVSSVSVKSASLKSFEDTIAENLLRMRLFNVMFASVIAFGVVYNSARIALSERGRELATLRVIGFTRGEISRIFLGEQAVLVLSAIPLGLMLGYGLAAFLVNNAYDSELFRIPLVVSRWTFGFAATVTLTAAIISGLIVRRRLDHLDLVAVLKSRE